jgi:AraC-like DNA-binding protein
LNAFGAAPVAPVLLRALLAGLHDAGIATAPLLARWPLTPPDLEAPDCTVTQAEALDFVRHAARLWADPQLGLRLGARSTITELGVLALGLLSAPTLGQATALSLRHAAQMGLLLDLSEVITPARHALVAAPLSGSHDLEGLLADHAFASLVRWRRAIMGTEYAPSEIHFVRLRPAAVAPYEQFFNCPVSFGRPDNRLIDGPGWSDFKLPLASASAFRLACQALERADARIGRNAAVAESVERVIRRMLPVAATPDQIAAMLNQSERTLRRRLAEEGTHYRLLLDEARKARALELLVTGRRSIAEAAEATGFVDKRNFRRAFKRWTGQVPSEAVQTS